MLTGGKYQYHDEADHGACLKALPSSLSLRASL